MNKFYLLLISIALGLSAQSAFAAKWPCMKVNVNNNTGSALTISNIVVDHASQTNTNYISAMMGTTIPAHGQRQLDLCYEPSLPASSSGPGMSIFLFNTGSQMGLNLKTIDTGSGPACANIKTSGAIKVKCVKAGSHTLNVNINK